MNLFNSESADVKLRGHSPATEQTLEAITPVSSGPRAGHQQVAIVERGAPQLSTETDNLLRSRLRTVSLLLFIGLIAFLTRALFALDRIDSNLGWVVFWFHIGLTVIAGTVGIRLCTGCTLIPRHLRVTEILLFGGAGVFFLLMSANLHLHAAPRGYVASILPLWLLLIFTYALFVPNTGRRAAIVIGAMAAAPVILVLSLWMTVPEFAKLVRENPDFRGYPLEMSMMMTVAAMTAVWGVRSIGSLRKQAFEARQLGQYRLKQAIGKGGMGEVYLAEHVLLKRPCAIKLIRGDRAGDAQALARFEREVKATAKLTHWNTVEIFDYGRSDDGTFYYVMEYLPGLNLGQLVEMHGPLPASRVIHFLAQACEALGEAHQQNLLHRDIKPANIFAAHRGGVYDVVKLLDFGLAKPLAELGDSSLTQEGTITGTPQYMSPEQAAGEDAPDARSDIYSLGAVAYYLMTGAPPFNSDRPLKVLAAHLHESPVPPSQHQPDLPNDLEQIVLRCLEKDPQDRFQDAESLRQALLSCNASGEWTREIARCWWENHGCPKKKALDNAALAYSGAN